MEEKNEDEPETYELKDAKVPKDEFFAYSSAIKQNKIPLIIDNGSCICRVGWATDKEPRLIFKNLIARTRKEKGKKESGGEVQVGNEIANIEAVRFQLKTPFDRNIITQFEAMEQVLDYIFLRLGVDTEGRVNHPIILTEAFLNLNYCRQLMTELLFESYNVRGVCYGVDSLFAYQQKFGRKSGIILSIGYHATHLIPILNQRTVVEHSRRINLGGFQIVAFLHRLLQLKYPAHANSITISRAEEMVHEHTFVAENYAEELQKWADSDHYNKEVHIIQLAYVAPVPVSTLTADQQKEKKKELQRRLTEINARRRCEKLSQEEENLNQLLDARELLETGQMKSLKRALTSLNVADVAALGRAITASEQKISAIKEKIQAASVAAEAGDEPKPPPPPPPQPVRDKEEMEAWLNQKREEREELLAKRAARRQRKRDLAQRRTAAAQERMRLINQLARKDKKEDNFGMRDEDWDVYKAINKDGGSSDSEEEADRLGELESDLKLHDPSFDSGNSDNMTPGESHQLHLAAERIRGPEVLFQPSLVGSHEAGIAETLEFMLKRFTPEEQNELVSNVFVTGGCASLPGLEQRLNRELMEMRPFESTFHVSVSEDPSLSAWKGAREFALSSNFKDFLVSRRDFEEKGGEFFKEHVASNIYYPSPKGAASNILNESV